MGDYISDLPDDVLCYILSTLTLRDAVRTRLLSPRWRYLVDCRPVIQIDALNVFGNESCNRTYQSKFVRLVDQFLEIRKDQNLSEFKLHFGLGSEYTSFIDTWILRVVAMGIKELDLNLRSLTSPNHIDKYVFSCHQLCPLTCSLTCLRLEHCELDLSCRCTSWTSNLTTLHLSSVRMNQNDLEFILSCALNLTSLSLEGCCFPTFCCLKFELLGLKKLVIDDSLSEIKLNCPNLEVFKYSGWLRNISLAYLPLLREVIVFSTYYAFGYSLIFAELIRLAPNLKGLSFFVKNELQPLPFPASTTKSCIKQLDLRCCIPYGFDIFTITYLLNASPSLEKLHLKLGAVHHTRQNPQKEYPDHPHFKLKEVKIDGLCEHWNLPELARYLLKNAVALKQMFIVCSSGRKEKFTTLLENVNANVELVIIDRLSLF